MKLNVLTVFCIFCFVQVYSGWEMSNEEVEQTLRDDINGASERFIGDFVLIFEKFKDEQYVMRMLDGLEQVLRRLPKNEKTLKIEADTLQKIKLDNEKRLPEDGTPYEWSVFADYIILVQQVLSKQLPPERYNDIVNWFYVITYPNATTEQIESALGYLYGTGDTKLKTPDLQTPNATDCPEAYKLYSDVNDKLKSFSDIKPEFLRDFAAIIEKFPCSEKFGIPKFLEYFVKIIDRLKTLVFINKTTISACCIKKESSINNGLNCSLMPEGDSYCQFTLTEVESDWKNVETILSIRLADENFREMFNFVKATLIDATPINEVHRSLEYVFTDVAAPDC